MRKLVRYRLWTYRLAVWGLPDIGERKEAARWRDLCFKPPHSVAGPQREPPKRQEFHLVFVVR